jgi:hypothetical protein
MVSVAGTSASSNVFSPSSAPPRALIPSIAARNIATTCSASRSAAPAAVAPARRNPVPQIGPEVPPIRLVMTTATFFRNVEISVRSNPSQSDSTISNPRAIE